MSFNYCIVASHRSMTGQIFNLTGVEGEVLHTPHRMSLHPVILVWKIEKCTPPPRDKLSGAPPPCQMNQSPSLFRE